MEGRYVDVLLAAIFISGAVANTGVFAAECNHQELDIGQQQSITLTAGSAVAVKVTVPASQEGSRCRNKQTFCSEPAYHWIRFDAHAQKALVHLRVNAYDEVCPHSNSTVGRSAVGRSVGVLQRLGHLSSPGCVTAATTWQPDSRLPVVYATLELVEDKYHPLPSEPTTVSLTAWAGNVSLPVPGGCCLECDVDEDPNLYLSANGDEMSVTAGDATMGLPVPDAGELCACDFIADHGNTKQQPSGVGTLEYRMYKKYMSSCGSPLTRTFHESQLFAAVASMGTAKDVKHNGHLVKSTVYPIDPKTWKQDIVPGQGVVFNVVVRDTRNVVEHPNWDPEIFESVYTPVAYYGCSFTGEPGLPNCHHLRSTATLVAAGVIALVGLFLATMGHRFFVFEIFLVSSIAWTFCFMIVFSREVPQWSLNARMGAALGSGVGAGALTFLGWYIFNATGTILIMIGSVFGGLVTAFVFATPLGDIALFENDFNFGMAFACFVLIWPVVLLLNGRLLNLISSSFVGCYMFMAGLDMYIGSDLAEVSLSVYKRAVLKDYGKDYSGSFFSNDFNGCANLALNLGMMAAWILLSFVCMAIQYKCFVRKLDFPESGFARRRRGQMQLREEGRPLIAVSTPPPRRSRMTAISPSEMARRPAAQPGFRAKGARTQLRQQQQGQQQRQLQLQQQQQREQYRNIQQQDQFPRGATLRSGEPVYE